MEAESVSDIIYPKDGAADSLCILMKDGGSYELLLKEIKNSESKAEIKSF